MLPPPLSSLQAGTTFGADFRLVRPLSSGGMGMVWVAEQLSTGKLRALKVIRAEVDDASARRRFVQEARVGAQIASEHIVEVITAGIDPSHGMPYLVMELLDGTSLDDLVTESGPMTLDATGEVLEQLCHGLAAAHDERIIHRDLKPENIYLARSRVAGRTHLVKILDFGIAKVLSFDATRTAPIGTPLWMAPEQMDERGKLGAATDVWALGLIAFFMLSGVSYWKTATNPNASMAMLVRELAVEALEPASIRARALGAAALPAGFDAWFARCVTRPPTDRFEDARKAGEAFRQVVAGEPARRLPGTVPLGTAFVTQRLTSPPRGSSPPRSAAPTRDRTAPAVAAPALVAEAADAAPTRRGRDSALKLAGGVLVAAAIFGAWVRGRASSAVPRQEPSSTVALSLPGASSPLATPATSFAPAAPDAPDAGPPAHPTTPASAEPSHRTRPTKRAPAARPSASTENPALLPPSP